MYGSSNDDERSVGTGFTKESSGTLMKLKEYINDTLPDDANDDDAATVITNMVYTDEGEEHIDENSKPEETEHLIITDGLHNVANDAKILGPRNGPLSMKSASSRSTAKSKNCRKVKHAPKKYSKDISLDFVLERLSNQEPEVPIPPKAAWESKVKFLADQIDQERDNGMKLADIEALLEKKKKRAKNDTEQAKWKSRVRDLEILLEERKREKDEKLRKLAVILGVLKKEKAEMKKYEKSCGKGAAGGKWVSKNDQYKTSVPKDRPSGGPGQSASLVRTVEPRKSFFPRSKSKHNPSRN